MTKPTQDKVVEAVGRAFQAMLKLADSEDKRRELMILTQLTYLELHNVNANIGSQFYGMMAAQPGAETKGPTPYTDQL